MGDGAEGEQVKESRRSRKHTPIDAPTTPVAMAAHGGMDVERMDGERRGERKRANR